MQCNIPVSIKIIGTHDLDDSSIEVFDAVDVNGEIVLPIRVPTSLGNVIDFNGDLRKWVLVNRGFCDCLTVI